MSLWAIATPPTCAGGRLLVNIIIRHYYYSLELVSYHWCIITDAANVRRWPSCLLFLPIIITALDLIFIIKTDRTDCVCVCVCVCESVRVYMLHPQNPDSCARHFLFLSPCSLPLAWCTHVHVVYAGARTYIQTPVPSHTLPKHAHH